MIHYFNNAGASQVSNKTLALMINHLNLESEIGAYHAANKVKLETQKFYQNTAKLINAEYPEEVAFMDSASRAWNFAINGIKLKEKARILTLSSEFGTNLITLYHLANKLNGELIIINCDEDGLFDFSDFESALTKDISLIAISHAAAHGSIINPINEIGKLAIKYGIPYIVDGCQAVGQLPVDVQKIGCDAYIATGRKWLRGPRGTGFLYISKNAEINTTQLDLASADLILDTKKRIIGLEIREDAKKFELWERNIANVLGFSNAISEALEADISSISQSIKRKSTSIRDVISNNPNLKLIGKVNSYSGIVGFYLQNPNKEDSLKNTFQSLNISISTMSDWDCPLHFPTNGAKTIFRLSPHYYTSDESIGLVIETLKHFS